MIHVIATVELNPDTRSKFLAEFIKLTPHVHAEEGCIEYGAALDIPTGIAVQVAARPDVVTIVEKWTSLEALKAHLIAPHMWPYRKRVKPFVIRTSLQVLAPVTEVSK